MIGRIRFLACHLMAASLLLAVDFSWAEDNAPASPSAAAPVEESKASKPALSPEMTALRDAVRQTLAFQQKYVPNTQANSATEIASYCLAFGCGAETMLNGSNGQRINGIGCLCWNYPCAGRELLGWSQNHIAPKIGYGYQERPGEFLAMLALARVKADYPIRVGEDKRTVADVVEGEKLGCRASSDLSLKLIGLSYYVNEPEWKNDMGETWSIERIIQDEMAQPVVTAPEGGLNRLLGLSYAVQRREKLKQPLEGQFQRAKKYTDEFQDFALKLQNSDGSWGPGFLATRSVSQDVDEQLRSTGRILEWLTLSLPDEKLENPQVAKAVELVTRILGSRRYQAYTSSLSTQEIVSAGHALHALTVYDQRVLQPADKLESKPEAEQAAPKTAERATSQL